MLFYNKIHFASIFVCQVLFMGCFPLCRCSGWFSEVEKQKVSLIMWWRSDSLEIIYTPNCQFFVSAPRSPQTLPKSPIHSILLVLRCFFQKMRSDRLSQWLPSALKAIWVSKTSQGRKWPDITQSNSSEWKLTEFTLSPVVSRAWLRLFEQTPCFPILC